MLQLRPASPNQINLRSVLGLVQMRTQGLALGLDKHQIQAPGLETTVVSVRITTQQMGLSLVQRLASVTTTTATTPLLVLATLQIPLVRSLALTAHLETTVPRASARYQTIVVTIGVTTQTHLVSHLLRVEHIQLD